MLPTDSFLLKLRLKITRNHDTGKRVGGFVIFGLQTFILLWDEVQSVLSITCKPFFHMLSTSIWGAGSNLRKSRFWPNFLTILYMYKIVRKFGQNRDFLKFEPAPQIEVLNIWKNGLQVIERTLWTSSQSSMKVWRPKITKPPTLLPVSWFRVIFRRSFNKNESVGNKRSTFVD